MMALELFEWLNPREWPISWVRVIRRLVSCIEFTLQGSSSSTWMSPPYSGGKACARMLLVLLGEALSKGLQLSPWIPLSKLISMSTLSLSFLVKLKHVASSQILKALLIVSYTASRDKLRLREYLVTL